MELFRLLGTVAIDNSGANTAIDQTTNKAVQSESKMSSAFTKIGSAAVKVGKVMAVGLAAGATAIGALTKSALDGYADYEQLVGGVETLFGAGGQSLEEYADSVGKTVDDVRDEYAKLMQAQTTVLKNADKAYKTAGLSANDYMETVTSFSAALIQSLNGDTVAASEKANQAIVDMSDNANKMGTAMESIQNAYQGFAKQNYTMLDNLKLGYGGTKEEMQRLLENAQAISGIEYDISSYADIVDAIHVIQEEMGIAGTTAKEATETISGSLSSMKSAWSNLLAGLGNEDANLSGLVDNFVNSFLVVADNVVPRLQIILAGMADVIAQVMPVIAEKLPEIMTSLLPSLITGATSLLTGLIAALPTILQVLIEQIPFIVTQIASALVQVIPPLIEALKTSVSQLWDSIFTEEQQGKITTVFQSLWETCQSIWNDVGQPIWDAISAAITYVQENWDSVSASISTYFGVMCDYWKSAWENIGKPVWDMISIALDSVAGLFKKNMPEIMGFFQNAIAGIKDTWENHLKPVFEAIGNYLNNYVKPIFEFVWQNIIAPLIENVFSRIGNLWTNTLKPIFDAICDFITGVFTGDWEKMGQSILDIVGALWQGICDSFNSIWSFLTDVWTNIEDDVTAITDSIWATVKKFINGMIGGIESMVNRVVTGINAIIGGINNVVSKAGNLVGLDIAIPLLSEVSLPRLEKGGVLEKGQVGILEGNGAEAVVPLDQNEKWINRVAQDMNSAVGDNVILQKILDVLLELREMLPEELAEQIATLKFEINNREFARLVKGA